MKKHRQFLAALASGILLVGGFTIATSSVAYAQDDDDRPRQSATLTPAVAKVLQVVFEDINAENWQAALTKLNDLVNARGANMKPYDKAVTYQLRGQVYAGLEQYRPALRDFQTAVDSGGLPPDQVNGLRYAIAQLNFALEDYNAAIRGLEAWINSGGTPDANAYYLLAAAKTQITPPRFREAMRPAEQAVALRDEPKKSDHDLLNLVYSELNENTKRAALLEKMINFWPDNRSYWTQLSGLYNQIEKDKDAFAVLEVAYRAGLLSKESEILTLVQYYSFFDNAYRGARVLNREMDAGNVKRNVKNLKLLSQLWSQSREHKRAIPILEQAAQQDDNGELYYRLGQVLIADEQYAKGETALNRARAKGGLTSRQIGDSWMLTGTARFSTAGPGDREKRGRAREAFVNAAKYDSSARQARSWIAYIDAINSTEKAQDELARRQAEEERKADIDRTTQQLQVCRIQGNEDCSEIEKKLEDLKAGDAQPEAPAAEAPAGDAEEAPAEEAAAQ